jgi:DNA-binding MarR family transcriptional regulator
MHATVTRQPAQAPALSEDDAQLVRNIGGFAKFILYSGGRDFYAAVGELELSISQIRTLHLLCREMDEVSLKTVADAIGLSLPAVSRSVDGLVQRGLVTRTENADDRRLKAVRATDEAHALVDRLMELRVAGITGFVHTLSPRERQKLAAALTPIVAREDIAPMCTARKDAKDA